MMKLALKSLGLLPVVLIVLTLLAAPPVGAADKGLKVQGAIL
jgi:hypothetical protein